MGRMNFVRFSQFWSAFYALPEVQALESEHAALDKQASVIADRQEAIRVELAAQMNFPYMTRQESHEKARKAEAERLSQRLSRRAAKAPPAA